MKTSDFEFTLPPKLIAQNPVKERTEARLMMLNREKQTISHKSIKDLTEILTDNDVLVFNETRVFPARVHGEVEGKSAEILMHRELEEDEWECLVKPGKRFSEGTIIEFNDLTGTVTQINTDGSRNIKFSKTGKNLEKIIDKIGEMPLPPYIKQGAAPDHRYQTVYAKERGSVAAPTAGLHFTPEILKKLHQKNIEQEFITLHVGRGTFEPIKVESVEDHVMHSEWFSLSAETTQKLNTAKANRKRIIAVGTTTTRVLETCAEKNRLTSQSGETDMFIKPGYQFQFIDGILTNFHLPKSTLLMLVSAFAGKEFTFKAYEEAITQKYRFYSFGDAMLIL